VSKNNFHWVRIFRNNKSLQYVPVILLNCPQEIDRKEALKAGVDDWYGVQYNWTELITRGRRLQRVRGRLRQPQPGSVPAVKGQNRFWKWGKRTLDVVAALFLLAICAPLFVVIALLIKLESKGPVIYRSKRAGQHYRIFEFLKFRSMYVDADERLKELRDRNQYGRGEATFVKIKNDPRITRVGRIIRKTSLDELPQLINVLRGDMSLVGNRPLPLYEAEKLCREESAERFSAPAGITGLWQVTKRGKTEMSETERISLDIEYSHKSSFLFDMKIVAKTLPAMLQHENV
jgi:lipopolysaccharide/colanic/teichoic acid biosynthesis glycosyltransferase